MSENQDNLSDQEFIYAYGPAFMAEELKGAAAARMKTLTENASLQGLPEKLNAALGKFQLAFQSYYLTEDQRVKLHEIVEDAEVRRTREIEKIAQVGRWEAFGDFRRKIGLFLIVAAIIVSIIYYFTPEESAYFDALESLAYEALAMEEDPEGRLDLPTQDMQELTNFFESNKALKFRPNLFKRVPSGWQPDGATVIEYDAVKVAVVQFSNKTLNEKMFEFAFRGHLSQLMETETGNFEGFIYQPYQTEFFNIVAWEKPDGVLNLLVGHRSVSELAAIARNSEE